MTLVIGTTSRAIGKYMTKPVVLSNREWRNIRTELQTEHPKSVFLLRTRMQQVLGFSVREHRAWVNNLNYASEYSKWEGQAGPSRGSSSSTWLNMLSCEEPDKGAYVDQICLDFYSENKRTMFLLKFSQMINTKEPK